MKRRLFILPLLAGMTLAGCSISDLFGKVSGDYDIAPQISGGSKKQKVAILEAINNLSPCVGRAANDYFPDTEYNLEEAPEGQAGGAVRVTTSQVYEDQTVELEWAVDESQPAFRSFRQIDEAHKLLEVKYPGFGNPDMSISWVLKSAKCGSAQTKGDKVASYKAKITGRPHMEEAMTIAQINSVKDEEETIEGKQYPSTFNQVDYTLESPYFRVIEEDTTSPEYHYVAVKGKVVYYAPDGNWLLLANGNQVTEVYAGAGAALVPKNFPSIGDQYVVVHGNLSQYCGNVQIGFVTSIETINKSEVTEPVLTPTAINEAWVDSVTLDATTYGGSQKQAIDGFMNSMGQVQGSIVAGSIRNSSGSTIPVSKISSSGRFTFDVSVATGKTVRVAYDYHTDQDGSVGVFNKLKAKLTSGGSITVKGTMRYSGDNSKPFLVAETKGIWNIVPFEAGHIS